MPEKQHMIDYLDDIELMFVELPKFTKAESELNNIRDKWLYFIKNAGTLDYVPKNFNNELEKAFEIANEANFTEQELELQHQKRDWVYMQKSSLDLAKNQGREEAKVEVAINLLDVLDDVKIADKTQLSLHQIQELRRKQQGFSDV